MLVPASAATSFPNDPFFVAGQQWGLAGQPASIDAPAAWCAATGSGITIADVDTGADFSHPDLQGKLIPGAAYLNATSPYPGPPSGSSVNDDNGHGTMTTGIEAADTNNGIGIAGVAPDAHVLVVKVLDSTGSGYDSDVANGIRWAADHGARVINVSIGPEVGFAFTLTSDIPDAVSYAESAGAAVILAAGNSSLPLSAYQGLSGNAYLIVGALNPDASIAGYSQSGMIYAPGGTGSSTNDASREVISTYNDGGYRAESGTSFATPHVSGIVALLMSRGFDNAGAISRVLSTATPGRGGQPDANAAAALGVSGTCGSTAPRPAPPPPPPAPAPPPSAPAASATPQPSASSQPQPSTSAAPQAPGSSQPGGPPPQSDQPPQSGSASQPAGSGPPTQTSGPAPVVSGSPARRRLLGEEAYLVVAPSPSGQPTPARSPGPTSAPTSTAGPVAEAPGTPDADTGMPLPQTGGGDPAAVAPPPTGRDQWGYTILAIMLGAASTIAAARLMTRRRRRRPGR